MEDSIRIAGTFQCSGDHCAGSSLTLTFSEKATISDLVTATSQLLGEGVTVKAVGSHGPLDPNFQLLHCDPVLSIREKKQRKKGDGKLITVTSFCCGREVNITMEAGTQLHAFLGGDFPLSLVRVVDRDGSALSVMQRMWLDTTVFLSLNRAAGKDILECSLSDPGEEATPACANMLKHLMQDPNFCKWVNVDKPSDTFYDEGLDDVTIYEATKMIVDMSGVSAVIVPPKLARQLLRAPLNVDAIQALRNSVGVEPLHRVVCIFAANGHWSLLDAVWDGACVHVVHCDGLHGKSEDAAHFLAGAFSDVQQSCDLLFEHARCLEQNGGVFCGAFALLHLGWRLNLWSDFNSLDIRDWYDTLRWGNALVFSAAGSMGHEAVVGWLLQFLPEKGVPEIHARSRAESAIKQLGLEGIERAITSKNPWQALKALGHSKAKPFMWVQHSELQEHIQAVARSKHGADIKKPAGAKGKKVDKRIINSLDPEKLLLADGQFVAADECGLPQLNASEVAVGARGLAFMHPQQVVALMTSGQSLSIEALAVLTVGEIPDDYVGLRPFVNLRFPAVYGETSEPVLVSGSLVQLGDVEVLRGSSAPRHEIVTCPTVVLRLQVYKDQCEIDWDTFVRGPVKCLLQHFPLLRLCRTQACKGCAHFHPSLEEQVESVLLDLWAWSWLSMDTRKVKPAESDIFSVYARVPESAGIQIQKLSGQCGLYAEPRCSHSPGPDKAFAVVWLPQASHQEAINISKRIEGIVAVARHGRKFGVRCQEKHEERTFKSLFPDKQFQKCDVTTVYRVAPLPVGTRRAGLQDILTKWKWVAKPLQPSKGSRGSAWEVGSAVDPPQLFFPAAHGDVMVTPLRSLFQAMPAVDIIASLKTAKSIRSSPHQGDDPWSGGRDPWSAYKGLPASSSAAPSQAAEKKLEAIEKRLQSSLEAKLVDQFSERATAMVDDSQANRLSQLEVDVAELRKQSQRFESWFQDAGKAASDSSAKIEHMQGQINEQWQATKSMQVSLQETTQSLSGLSVKVDSFRSAVAGELREQLDQHTARLEAMLAKKQRHE